MYKSPKISQEFIRVTLGALSFEYLAISESLRVLTPIADGITTVENKKKSGVEFTTEKTGVVV